MLFVNLDLHIFELMPLFVKIVIRLEILCRISFGIEMKRFALIVAQEIARGRRRSGLGQDHYGRK